MKKKQTPDTQTADAGAPILESRSDGIFEVLVIQPGLSGNRRRYRREVLQEAVPLFDGARAFASEGPDHDPTRRGVKSLVGFHSNPRYVEGINLPDGRVAEGIVTDFHALDPQVRLVMAESFRHSKPDLVGFSIVGDGDLQVIREAHSRTPVVDVRRIKAIESIDVVVNPAAGGTPIRLVASKESSAMEWNTLTLAEAVKGLAAGTILPDELKENRADLFSIIDAGKIAEAVEKPEEPAAEPAAEPKTDSAPIAEARPATESVEKIVESMVGKHLTSILVEGRLARVNLPDVSKERIREATKDKALSEAQVDALIKREADYLAAVNPALVKDAGPKTSGMKSERERISEAMYDILAGKSSDSFRSMYVDLTGDSNFTGRFQEGGRLTESLETTSWTEILGDSITRRMLDYYRLPDLGAWRNIVSVVPVRDFRTQRRIRFGGYGNLPVVAEGDAYTALTSPTDEEATYSPAKRGGTEDLTMEMVVNDDLGAIREIPRRLGRAAAQTLHEFVFDFIATNPVIYDGLALFVAGHNNLGTSALDATSLAAARLRMLKQTDMNNGKRLGIQPRFLMVPVELEQTAYELTQTDREVGSANNTLNFIRTFGLSVIVVSYWSDTNNWFLAADPAAVPTIEIGFLNGREEPELFLQDEPTVGQVFSNDKLTYKIRHIYGGGVMDFRGLDGSIVA